MRTSGTLIAFFVTLAASAALAQTGADPADDAGQGTRATGAPRKRSDSAGPEAPRPTSTADPTNAEAVAPLYLIHAALAACFAVEHGRNPDMPGEVVLGWTIRQDGRAVDVELHAVALRGRPVEGCVEQALATLRWPPFTGQEKKVRVPLTLPSPYRSFAVMSDEVAAAAALEATPGGSLLPSEVRALVASERSRIMQCYEDELAWQPDLAGRVTLHWVIRETGDVGDVFVRQTTMDNEPFQECLMGVVRAMRFPRPRGRGVVKIDHPFVFSAGLPGRMTRARVSGGLDHQVVEQVVSALPFDPCSDATASHIERADVRFIVSPGGEVTTAETMWSSMVKPQAEACLRDVIKAATFPAATSETRVTWPLVFVPDPPAPPPPRPVPAGAPSKGCAWPW